jgi:prevent-host-death family protein
MRTITASELKAKCLGLLDDVARTRETILVTKRGKPVARLMPPKDDATRDPFADMHGMMEIVGDIIAPPLPPEAWEAIAGPPRSRRTRRRR